MQKFKKIALAIALSSLSGASVYAQDQNPPTDQADGADDESITDLFAVEEIVITGTRIRRDNLLAPMSVYSISKEDIETVGTNALSEILLENPGIVSGTDQTNSTNSLQGSGLSTIDLRNLGDNRTLILIDGRRAVSNSAQANRVSLGTIPSGFVDRVEVITGGASAIYGSDAIAGVVNIITEKNQEGFNLSMNYGEARNLRTNETSFELSFGHRFADDKGYVLLATNLEDQAGLRALDVPRALIQADWRYRNGENQFDTIDGFKPARTLNPSQYADLASDSDIPGGRFESNKFWYDGSTLKENFAVNSDGFDFRRDVDIFIPRERLNVAFKLNYDFGGAEFFSNLMYSEIETDNIREAEGDDYNDPHTLFDPVTGETSLEVADRIPLNNPFVPVPIKIAASDKGVRWDRRFTEVGNQRTINNRETLRSSVGFRGKFLNTWEWETSAGFGQFTQTQTRFNEINILNLRQGLNAEVGPDGNIRCVDETARNLGCVPVNLFGAGSIRPDAADYIRANLSLTAELEQTNFTASINGSLFSLYAGDVRAALGVEYRKDTLDLVPGALNRNGGHSSNFVPAFTGESDVGEIFSELSIPLLADIPGIRLLTWDLSVRHANYGQLNVDAVTSFGTGIQWRLYDDLNLRTSFNRALRAPDLTELFSPERGDTDRFRDICDSKSSNSTERSKKNCLFEPGVIAYINNNGKFKDEDRTKISPNAGNLELTEESAETFTAGFVWKPNFTNGLRLSSDYYNIEIEDVIGTYSNTAILRQCYDVDTFDKNSYFCRQITRDSEGQISKLVQQEQNLDSLKTSGVDTSFTYTLDMDYAGELTLRYVHTHVITHTQVAPGVTAPETTINKGYLDRGIFEDRSRFELKWKNEGFSASWRVRYYGPIIEDESTEDDYREALAENPLAERPLYLDVGSEMFHDLSISHKFKVKESSLRLFTGVRNALNNEGPFLPDGTDGGDTNSSTEYGSSSLKGRFFYAGFDLRI